MIAMQVKGLDDVLAALADLRDRDAARVAKAAVNGGVTVLVAGAYRRCPVRTGKLRQSIRRQVDATEDGVTGQLIADAGYAGFVEEGTRFMKGRHFLRDTLEQDGEKAIAAVRRAVREGLAAINKRGR
jgi:HK97 gp10 family phage protein